MGGLRLNLCVDNGSIFPWYICVCLHCLLWQSWCLLLWQAYTVISTSDQSEDRNHWSRTLYKKTPKHYHHHHKEQQPQKTSRNKTKPTKQKTHPTKKLTRTLSMMWKVEMIKKWDMFGLFFSSLATCSMCFPCLLLQENLKWGFMVIPPRKFDIISPTGGTSVFQGGAFQSTSTRMRCLSNICNYRRVWGINTV